MDQNEFGESEKEEVSRRLSPKEEEVNRNLQRKSLLVEELQLSNQFQSKKLRWALYLFPLNVNNLIIPSEILETSEYEDVESFNELSSSYNYPTNNQSIISKSASEDSTIR